MSGKKRTPNWTDSERLAATELIVQNSDTLFGRFRGSTSGARLKNEKWGEICNELNASGKTSCARDVDDIKTMFRNQKTRAKTKADNSRQTGGGPHQPLGTVEELVLDHMRLTSKSSLEGISGGYDSMISLEVPDDIMNGAFSSQSLPLVNEMGQQECAATPNETEAAIPYGSTCTLLANDDSSHTYSLKMTDPISTQNVEGANLLADTNSTKHVSAPIQYEKNVRQKSKTYKRMSDDNIASLYLLEKKKLEEETNRFEAEKLYFQHKDAREEKLFLLNEKILKKQLDQLEQANN